MRIPTQSTVVEDLRVVEEGVRHPYPRLPPTDLDLAVLASCCNFPDSPCYTGEVVSHRGWLVSVDSGRFRLIIDE